MKDLRIIDKNTGITGINELEGFVLLIDKPEGWTSFDVVAKLKNILNIKKIGHAGTLDPFATGLLIMLVGKATKTQDSFMKHDKIYDALIKFGEATDSQDRTGKVTDVSENIPDIDTIKKAAAKMTGEIDQIPPMFSAIKKNGKRLYELARKGKEIEREPRKITIHSSKILSFSDNMLNLMIHCSKGTYIRTYAHDLGIECGSSAHLLELRRISAGKYNVADAFSIKEFDKLFNASKI